MRARLALPSAREIGRTALTLAIAAAGGCAATLAGMPAGWVAGGLIAVAAASLAGIHTTFPRGATPPVFLVLGLYAGGGVTPAALDQMRIWPASFAILGLSLVGVVVGSVWYLTRRCGWARNDALLSSLPGALSFVVAAAEGLRADLKKVAIVQSVRLIILIEAIPLIAFLIGHRPEVSAAMRPTADAVGIMLMLGLGTVLGAAAVLLRFPGGWIVGGLAASAALQLGGVVQGGVPTALIVPATIALAAIAGSRFRPGDLALLPSLARPALGAFAIALVFSVLGAGAVTLLFGIGIVQTLLAFAPGALEALIVLATQMNIDPAYVAAHHMVRFIGLVIAVPILARWMARGAPPSGTPSGPPEAG